MRLTPKFHLEGKEGGGVCVMLKCAASFPLIAGKVGLVELLPTILFYSTFIVHLYFSGVGSLGRFPVWSSGGIRLCGSSQTTSH